MVRRRRVSVAGAVVIAAALGLAPAAGASDGPARSYLFAPSFASNTVTVFDVDTGELVKYIGAEARGPCCAHATPDGSTVFVVDGLSPYVTVIDVAALEVTQLIRLSGTWGDRGTPIQHDGRLFWISNLPEGHVEAIDTHTGEVVRRFPFMANTFTVSRDGETLYSVNLTALPTAFSLSAMTFASRSAATGQVIGIAHLPLALVGVPLKVYASPDDTKVYVQLFNSAGTVHVVDVRDRSRPRYVKTFRVGSVPIDAVFTSDGTQMWFPNSGDGTVAIVDVSTDEVVHVIDVGHYVAGVAILDEKAFVSISPGPLPPTAPTSQVLLFAGLIPGAILIPPSGSSQYHPLFQLPGEIRLYDTHTYQRMPVAPMTTPSVSHVMEIVPAH